MSQALYRKWRSRTFSDLVGQPHVVRTLQNALDSDRVAHAYLFNGPRGTGKTSTARLLAKALNCVGEGETVPCGTCHACRAIEEARYLDLIEIDAASNNGVDDIRDLRNAVSFSPTEGACKVYIIDEVHMLSASAFNALLKTLEEPPAHVYFILATTEIHRIPATVISRCQRFDFRRIRARDIKAHLALIAEAEDCAIEPAALALIADSAQGCMRDAISLLDQVVGFGRGHVSLAQVLSILGLADLQAINDFIESIVQRDKGRGLAVLEAITAQGTGLTEFLQQTALQMRYALRLRLTGDEATLGDVSPEQQQVLAQWVQVWDEAHLLHALMTVVEALADCIRTPHPHIVIELALIRAIDGPAMPEPATATSAPAAAIPPVSANSAWSQASASAPAHRPVVQAEPVRPAETKPAVHTESEKQDRPARSEEEEAKLAKLRKAWTNIRKLLEVREARPASQALSKKGMAELRIVGGTVYMVFKTDKFYGAVRDELEWLTEQLTRYLGESVELDLQTGVKADIKSGPVNGPHTAAPPDPLRELDTYLAARGWQSLAEPEQKALVARRHRMKEKKE